jgi:hypothetical protein
LRHAAAEAAAAEAAPHEAAEAAGAAAARYEPAEAAAAEAAQYEPGAAEAAQPVAGVAHPAGYSWAGAGSVSANGK